MTQTNINLNLDYTMFCEDVRLEASNQLSLMGVIHQIIVPQLPVALFKFAVVNHWRGSGEYLSEVRILAPDRRRTVAVSQPASFSVNEGGYADNVTVFVNTSFAEPGNYVVQTLINSTLFAEKVLPVIKLDPQRVTESSRIN